MKNAVFLIGMVVVAGLAFVAYRSHQQTRAEQVAAGRVQYEAQRKIDLKRWKTSEYRDEITDAVTFHAAANSDEGMRVDVSCSGAGNANVSFHSKSFYPSDSAFYVSYRFDAKPGVRLERWYGNGEWTDAPDPDAFIVEMASASALVIEVGSGVMPHIVTAHFGFDGAPAAIAYIREHCPARPRKA